MKGLDFLCHEPSIYENETQANKAIVNCMQNGCLTLFIGTGVSISATEKKFPGWVQLVTRCVNKINAITNSDVISLDPTREKDNGYLQDTMQKVYQKHKDHYGLNGFPAFVKECLYDGVEYGRDVLKSDILFALGGLVMGSIRGSVNSVVTYNYDDLLEWYLKLHGLKVQIIEDYPKTVGQSDVCVYHPHGFLPLMKELQKATTEKILITRTDYIKNSENGMPWNTLQQVVLSSNVPLFIGFSGEDEHVEQLCHRAKKTIKEKNPRRTFLGFIYLQDNSENREKQLRLSEAGLVPIYFGNYDELPQRLLDIAQLAAGGYII